MTSKRRKVPAVANALAILEALREGGNEPQTLTDLARATSMNVSTCFNILKTLEDGQVIAFDPSTKTYRLGIHLAKLGALVDERRQATKLVMQEARRLVDEIDLGCFVMTFTDGEEFVVLDKVDSRKPIRVTIDEGARFPATGAVAFKAWFAWADPKVTTDVIERHGLPDYTPNSITDPERLTAELAVVRERGYSTSLAEYYADHNALAAPIFGWDGRPQFLFVVVGTASQLAEPELHEVGEAVAAAAKRSTVRIGGRPGEQLDEPPQGDVA